MRHRAPLLRAAPRPPRPRPLASLLLWSLLGFAVVASLPSALGTECSNSGPSERWTVQLVAGWSGLEEGLEGAGTLTSTGADGHGLRLEVVLGDAEDSFASIDLVEWFPG